MRVRVANNILELKWEIKLLFIYYFLTHFRSLSLSLSSNNIQSF